MNDMKVVCMLGIMILKYKCNFNCEILCWDYLILLNRYLIEIFRSVFWMDEERILEIGYFRNDVLVNRVND